jgi:SPP1 Gp6-like portal protein
MVATFSQSTQSQTVATCEPTQADMERRREIGEAWKAYRGKLKDPLKVAKDQPNDNVKANRCAPIADKGVSFLFGQVLKIECDEQEALDAFWQDDDDKMTTLVKLSMNGAACGQAFVKLCPAQDKSCPPRMVILDPMLIRVISLPEDCECYIAYIIEYPVSSRMQKKQVISCVDTNKDIDQISEKDIQPIWTITNYTRVGDRGNWQKMDSDTWDYPFPPIFTCQNLPNPNEPWGLPDLSADLIEMNKVLNFILSNISRIVKYHGHPITWASGVGNTPINISPENLIILQAEGAKIEKIAAMENFTGLLSVVADLRSDMDEQSRVPAVALGRLVDLPKGNISGVALQLLFQPLIEKTILKQRLYGKLIREVSRAALVLCGAIQIEEYATYPIDLQWQSLLPIDDLAAAQTAMLYEQLGVSTQTLLAKLGFDPDDEAKKSAEEDANKPQAPAPLPGQPAPGQPPAQPEQEQENAA